MGLAASGATTKASKAPGAAGRAGWPHPGLGHPGSLSGCRLRQHAVQLGNGNAADGVLLGNGLYLG